MLTKRANGAASHVELAGFPHHSLETYLPKLVNAREFYAPWGDFDVSISIHEDYVVAADSWVSFEEFSREFCCLLVAQLKR